VILSPGFPLSVVTQASKTTGMVFHGVQLGQTSLLLSIPVFGPVAILPGLKPQVVHPQLSSILSHLTKSPRLGIDLPGVA
ncbi:hypothetical protein, partial [Escherichia coli]|uniref:hypothetical protein n=1 Tax=Escherichia coli TaxID=562 RepID=UPI003B8151E2